MTMRFTKWPHGITNKTTVRLAKIQIRPVWSESSLSAQCVAKDPCFLRANSENSYQTWRMPRLIWVLAGRTCHFVGFVMRWIKRLTTSYTLNNNWIKSKRSQFKLARTEPCFFRMCTNRHSIALANITPRLTEKIKNLRQYYLRYTVGAPTL